VFSIAVSRLGCRNAHSPCRGAVPAGLLGRWCVVWARTGRAKVVTVRIRSATAVPGEPIRSYLRVLRFAGVGWVVLHIPPDARELDICCYGADALPALVAVHASSVGRAMAAVLLLAGNPAAAARALRGDPRSLPARLRAAANALAVQPKPPASYGDWIAFFDRWDRGRCKRVLDSADPAQAPRVVAVVFHDAGTPAAALAASLASVGNATVAVEALACGPGHGSLPALLDGIGADYIGLLQAGEVVPPHGFALAAHFIAALGRPAAVLADEDLLAADGTRHAPLFKPQPSRSLMVSGLLSRGLWLIRRDVLAAHCPAAAAWAETARLEVWLRLHESGLAHDTWRIPHILTHRRCDTQAAPPAAIANTAAGHFAPCGLPIRIDAARFPIDASLLPFGNGRVCIIIPSACRKEHVLRCIPAIVANNSHGNFEVIVVVSQPQQPDEDQLRTLREVTRDGRVRTVHHAAAGFNYAAANNHAAAQTTAELLCLVNDDVQPVAPDWLAILAANLGDPEVAAVGAKLLYPDRTVQHGGMIMGLAGLCGHAFRHLAQGDGGYGGRALLDQEMSAVTGACLLVRHDVYDAVGGLDETFASAFSDVDLCLKIRALGRRIVWSAHAELFHLETQTFGRYYAPDQAPRALADAALFWQRWRTACEDDPYYNPNLSLVADSVWTPAFPPRHGHLDRLTVRAAGRR
jgi:GT2 family glycosyltransferase